MKIGLIDADLNYGDISKIDWTQVPDFDLFTYSFPCTDISAAGLQKGLSKDSGTRSGLLWECEKAIKAKRPKYLLMENVKALVQKKFMPDFKAWLELLDQYGYDTFWQVCNAKKQLMLTNSVGVVDSGYRGEILFKFKRFTNYYTTYKADGQPEWNIGDRIGQLIIIPYPRIELEEVEELEKSDRGSGGYGSTGK